MMLLAIINFNSIKVRLEQAADLSLARFSRYFNSIKVRLERPKGIMIPITGIKTRQGLGRDSVPRKERNNYETFFEAVGLHNRGNL